MVRMSDIARSVGVSVGTVDRALNNRGRIGEATKARVLRAAESMRYHPNLSASILASGRRLRISVILPTTTKVFYDEVRCGIDAEHRTYANSLIQLEYRSFPRFGVGERAAFRAALDAGADGIISAFSEPQKLPALLEGSAQSATAVVAVVTGGPSSGHVPGVSIDPGMSGALAAGLMGKTLQGRPGKVAVETGDLHAWEHKHKIKAFAQIMKTYYPHLRLLPPVETRGLQKEAFQQTSALITAHPDLIGYYVSTANSMAVIRGLKVQGLLGKVALITTDVFPRLLPHLRSGAVTATLYQRPRVQGELALRMLYNILCKRNGVAENVLLQPHVIMRENLMYFDKRGSCPSSQEE
jgi:LacI family transcriptional regulator